MARRASVRYWPGRKGGGYFCVYRGSRYELALGPDDAPNGPTYLKAHDAFKHIMTAEGRRQREEERLKTLPTEPTIREVLEYYVRHIIKTKKPGTVEIRLRSFGPFVNHQTGEGLLGERPVSRLTHQDVYDFLGAMEKPRKMVRKRAQKRKPVSWGMGSQRNFLLGAIAAFNWAQKGRMIRENPLKGIDKPQPVSRGAESLIGGTAEQVEANHQLILGNSRFHWRPFLQALKDTGARPGELCAVTAGDFRPETGAFVFRKEATRRSDQFSHKTAKKKDRVIFLSGTTLAEVKRLVELQPTGPLFRRPNGSPFTLTNVVDRFIKLRKRLPLPNLTAYSYRHQFATDMLKAGCDIDTLAELMGNSAAVIRQHYSHLLADKQALREKLELFRSR